MQDVITLHQVSIGSALVPYTARFDHALQNLLSLSSHSLAGPQRDWLKKIATQTKAILLVDHAALDGPAMFF